MVKARLKAGHPGVDASDAAAAERALAIGYAPDTARPALGALFALDAELGQILRTTREPAIGQIRLTWWRDALVRLDEAPPPAQPILTALAERLLTAGITGTRLSDMVEGWYALLEAERLDEAALLAFGRERGAGLFAIGTELLGEPVDWVADAGIGWALSDLSLHLRDRDERLRAQALARGMLDRALRMRWPGKLRPLGALAHLARMDLTNDLPAGSRRRALRLLLHRSTGR